jgi:hypothetical protein
MESYPCCARKWDHRAPLTAQGTQGISFVAMKRIKPKPKLSRLRKKAKKGFRGFPAATVALYGPTDTLATKMAVAILSGPGRDPDVLERWFSPTGDVDIRRDPAINEQVAAFIKSHKVRSVAATDGVLGCPHEEGVDYPEGTSCPQCPFWAAQDRIQ